MGESLHGLEGFLYTVEGLAWEDPSISFQKWERKASAAGRFSTVLREREGNSPSGEPFPQKCRCRFYFSLLLKEVGRLEFRKRLGRVKVGLPGAHGYLS